MKSTTRRGVLGAIAVAPVVVATGATATSGTIIPPAVAPSAARADGGRWYRLKARHDRLRLAYQEFVDSRLTPATKAASAEIDRLPHVTAGYPGWAWKRGVRQTWTLTTSNPADVRDAKAALARGSGYEPEFIDACRQIADADNQRSDATGRINRNHRLYELEDRADRLGNFVNELQWRLMAMPAPDAAAALWKFDNLMSDDGMGSTEMWNLDDSQVRAAVSDIRRCLGGEA